MKLRLVSGLFLLLGASSIATRAWADSIPADKLPEPAITTPGVEGDYLRRIHQHIHKRWAGNFLLLAAEKLPLQNPVNDPNRAATAELIINGDGQIVSVALSKSGGFPGFDDAIIEVLRDAVPFPDAPAGARSDDNNIHLRWSFARDQRRCSEVAVIHVEDPLAIAVPKLLRDRREAEVLRRIHASRAAGVALEPMMSTVAADWLKATINAPSTTVRVAEKLAALGEHAGVRWLELAVKRPELALTAGRALAALHVPICPLVDTAFDTRGRPPNFTDQQNAAIALGAAGEVRCAPGLIALLQSPKARPEARAAAAVALGPISDQAAQKALLEATKDAAVSVRAAAILASVRPGSGRKKVFGLVPFLRDPSPEVRAAAAAGVVRAGGDTNLDDLYVIFKDSDPRPALAVALELDRLQTEESTKFLVRLLKRPQVSVRLAAARALVKRRARDWFAALRPDLDHKTDPELWGLALVSADSATLDRQAAGLTQDTAGGPKYARLAMEIYRARLARGERAPAADVLIATAARLSPGDQADAMADWLTSQGPLTPSAAGTHPGAPAPVPAITAGRASPRR